MAQVLRERHTCTSTSPTAALSCADGACICYRSWLWRHRLQCADSLPGTYLRCPMICGSTAAEYCHNGTCAGATRVLVPRLRRRRLGLLAPLPVRLLAACVDGSCEIVRCPRRATAHVSCPERVVAPRANASANPSLPARRASGASAALLPPSAVRATSPLERARVRCRLDARVRHASYRGCPEDDCHGHTVEARL